MMEILKFGKFLGKTMAIIGAIGATLSFIALIYSTLDYSFEFRIFQFVSDNPDVEMSIIFLAFVLLGSIGLFAYDRFNLLIIVKKYNKRLRP